MKTRSCLTLLLIVSSPLLLSATSIEEKPLEQLVAEADHVIVGKVTRVTMRNWIGWQIKDPKARTGPGSRNEIRLHVTVQTNGVLKTNKRQVPTILEIPLWRMWHYSLGSAKAAEGQTYIFLLKGEEMERVYHGYFQRDLNEKAAIQSWIEQQSGAKKSAERCSEREPAVSLRANSIVIGGWLPSLTFSLGR